MISNVLDVSVMISSVTYNVYYLMLACKPRNMQFVFKLDLGDGGTTIRGRIIRTACPDL